MKTKVSSKSFWANALNWLLRLEEAVSYDSTQYTFDRMTSLQRELKSLTVRLERLENLADGGSRSLYVAQSSKDMN